MVLFLFFFSVTRYNFIKQFSNVLGSNTFFYALSDLISENS